MVENCAETFGDVQNGIEACQEACAEYPADGNLGDAQGDTVQCRQFHAALAGDIALDEEERLELCGIAGPEGGGVCGLPFGKIDRMGRPAINTALISADNKDAFNQATPGGGEPFIDEMVAALEFVDGLDGDATNGLLADQREALGALLANDVLKIDISIDNCENGYLALELGIDGNCGGRTLAEDVMDKTLQSLVGTAGVTDAVDSEVEFLDDFPYLPAAPTE